MKYSFVAVMVMVAGCTDSAAVVCGDLVCPAGNVCDEVHHGCTTQALQAACASAADGASCTVDVQDDGVCDQHVCIPQRCGDGYRLGGEACDGAALGDINNCQQLGFYDDVALACTDRCELDQSVCTGYCGDGMVSAPQELCDGALPEATCVDFGYGAGQLQCSANCGPGVDSCVPFGWQHIAMPHATQAVSALSRANVWVVGDTGMVRHFDGVAWSELDASACTTGNINQVVAISATEAWLLLSDGVGFLSSSGCTSFPSSEGFTRIWAPSASELWAAASSGLWHLQGGTWTQVDALQTQGIWGSGPTDVYATTDDTSDSATIGRIRHYDGASWSSPVSTGIPDLFDVWGSSPTDVYISGSDPTVGPVIKHKTGATWTTVLSGSPLMSAASTSVAILGTSAGRRSFVDLVDFAAGKIFMLSSVGGDWVNMDGPSEQLIPSGASDGSMFAAAVPEPHIYTLDGAATFDQLHLFQRLMKVAAVSENVAAALASPTTLFGSPELWTWNGATWTSVNNGYLYLFSCPGHVLAMFNNGVHELQPNGQWSASSITLSNHTYTFAGCSTTDFHYSDNGTWYRYSGGTSTPETFPFTPIEVWSASTTVAFAFGADGHIARWTSGTWAEMTSPVTVPLANLWGRSATEVYASTANQMIRFDGTSWTQFPAQPVVGAINVIWAGGPDDVFIGTDIGVQHWDGMHWNPVASGTSLPAVSMSGANDTVFIGSQDATRILTRTRAW